MRITTIINGKGGVGKTTTAHALSSGLSNLGNKTLAIDYDPQGNLSHAFGADIINSPTVYHVINGDISIEDAIQHMPQGDIIVGNASLTKIESLFSGDDIFEGLDKLKECLEPLAGIYSHIFIDNQPLIGGILTRQTLIAANDLIVPMTADTFTIQGLARLEKAVDSIQRRDNPKLTICGILLTRHNPRTILSSGIGESIKLWAIKRNTKVFDTYIRESVSVREAQAKRQSIFEYAPNCNPAQDYMKFIEEYLQSGEERMGYEK